MNLDDWVRSSNGKALQTRDEQRLNVASALIRSNLDDLLVRYHSAMPGCNNSNPGLLIENPDDIFRIADEGTYAGLIGIEPWLHDRIVLYPPEFHILISKEFTPVQIGITAHETFAAWYQTLPEHLKIQEYAERTLAVSLEAEYQTVLLKYNPARYFSG